MLLVGVLNNISDWWDLPSAAENGILDFFLVLIAKAFVARVVISRCNE